MKQLSLLLLALAAISAQTPTPVYEVVSIKPPARPGGRGAGVMQGGPGTTDPGQFAIRNMAIRTIILRAYAIQEFQLTGPAWMESERYDIVAKVPAGTNKADSLPLLRSLLAERFHLVLRREQKELPGYNLVVAKGGPKFMESAPTAENGDPMERGLGSDKNGYPILAPGASGTKIDSAMYGGAHTQTSARETMSNFALELARELGKPVTDGTGLTAQYDFKLHWVGELTAPPGEPRPTAAIDGPDLPAAIQQQLGLKLEPRRVPTEILVVEHVEKAMVEN
jgi:uncharacterized protein (TIGR03435 family)